MPSPQLSPLHWCLSGTSTSTPLRSTAIQCFPLSKPSTTCRKLSPSPPEVPSHRNPPLTTFTLLTLYLSLTLSSPLSSSDHSCILLSLSVKPPSPTPSSRKMWIYQQADFEAANDELATYHHVVFEATCKCTCEITRL